MKYLGEIEDPKDLVTKEYIFNAIYPVGSIYMSVNATSPETLFGGTWQKIEGQFLLGSSSSYTLGSTGGSADAVVVSHTHPQVAHTHTVSGNSVSHTHSISGGSHNHKYGAYKNRSANGSGRDTPGSTTGGDIVYNTTSTSHSHTCGNNSASHTHVISGGATTTGAASGAVAGTGKNMPPYLSVNIWKRTA